MTTTERMMRLGWRGWLHALAKATIGGGANGIVTSIVVPVLDPEHFAIGLDGWFVLVGWTFATSATVALAYFLQKSPLPDFYDIEQEPKG